MTQATKLTLTVAANQLGFRADRALAALAPELNRRDAKALFHASKVRLNGRVAKGADRVKPGDTIEIPSLERPETREILEGKNELPPLVTRHGRQVARLFEDETMIVLSKPPGIPIHHGPEGKSRRETLEDVLEPAYPPPGVIAKLKTPAQKKYEDELEEEDQDEEDYDEDSEGESFGPPPPIRGKGPRKGGDDEDFADADAPPPIRGKGMRGSSEDESFVPRDPKAPQGFYFVHRLDLDTTGCILVAKSPVARDALIRDFEARRVGKIYWALVVGEIPWDKKVVTRPITYIKQKPDREKFIKPAFREDGEEGGPEFNPYNKLAWSARKGEAGDFEERGGRATGSDWLAKKQKQFKPLRAVKKGVALEEGSEDGKSCETTFTVEQRFKGFTLVKCEPKTGRLHQIRVHLSAEGFPLAYDNLYGRRSPLRLREFMYGAAKQQNKELPNPNWGKRKPYEEEEPKQDVGAEIVLNRCPLHAWKITFTHPKSGERMTVEAPLPRDLKDFVKVLKKFKSRE